VEVELIQQRSFFKRKGQMENGRHEEEEAWRWEKREVGMEG